MDNQNTKSMERSCQCPRRLNPCILVLMDNQNTSAIAEAERQQRGLNPCSNG